MRVIYIFILIIMSMFGGDKVEIQSDLVKCMSTPNSIVIYSENDNTTISTEDSLYNKITENIITMCNNAREMPALGVALDRETRVAMETGLWLELVYNNTQQYNEMPFNTLLIQVEKEYSGFNIIRKYKGKYDGRCFYLSLNGDMSTLYNTLTK